MVPYNERVLAAFGGGTVHFCGSAKHQIDNLAAMKNCSGINNFLMDDIEQGLMLRDRFKGRGAVMLCDYNAVDIKRQCERWKLALNDAGSVIANMSVAPRMALVDGKYLESDRTREEIVSAYMDYLGPWMERDQT